MKRWMAIVCICMIEAGVASAGTNPTNVASIFVIDSIQLNPETFEVTLVVNVGGVRAGMMYGVEAHTGQPTTNAVAWTLIGTQEATGSKLTFVDHLSGPLLHPGKTYRGVINGAIFTVNEAFVGYPRLKDPNVRVCGELQGDTLAIGYGEGIYSNTVSVTLPADVTTAFFRMWSADDDPTNAVIQVCTNSLGSTWNNCPAK